MRLARHLARKVMEDDVPFMASAVAFSILVATLPLVVLAVGVAGYVLSAAVPDPADGVARAVGALFPPGEGATYAAEVIRGVVTEVLEQRSGLTFLGAALFAWLATRLVGTLRAVLRRVFDVDRERGVVHGKLFDLLVVVAGSLLLTVNLGVTLALGAAVALSGEALGLGGDAVGVVERLLGQGLALASVWALFLGAYRFLPAGRVPWRTAAAAATFSALCHEAMKTGFSWYATRVADYGSTWGSLGTVAVLFFWIYYEAVVFILGGEVAHVFTVQKGGSMEPVDGAGGAA